MFIKLIGTTGISTLAVAVVVTFASGLAQNSQAILDLAFRMFWGLLFAIIAITFIINSPKILR
jgi:hypothetical protein